MHSVCQSRHSPTDIYTDYYCGHKWAYDFIANKPEEIKTK